MRLNPQDMGTLHLIGIGGIGMSGIAEILHAEGFALQGSDLAESPNVLRLRDKGIPIAIGHAAAHIEGAAAVIISSAVKDDNPELKAARDRHLPVIKRADMLAEIMRMTYGIAISGTHGKTTTTSMVGTMLEVGGFDPTVINGGIVNSYGTNVRLGHGEWIVAEADESDGTFTRLPAMAAVVTNIDPEHLDFYGSFDNAKAAFRNFVNNLPFYGFAVLCSDHPEVQNLIPQLQDRRVITYGFNPQADVRIMAVRVEGGSSVFDLHLRDWVCGAADDRMIEGLKLAMLGNHNILNATAAVIIGHEMGMDDEGLKAGLAAFKGVKRRFTVTGTVNGVTVIDDYAHHPVEIAAVLQAAKMKVQGTNGRIFVVKQPHRYSRLKDLFDDFAGSFHDADHVYIADVYAAGEDPIDGVDSKALAAEITKRGHKNAQYLEDHTTLADILAPHLKPDDLVIFMGAGDITKWAYDLPEALKEM